MLSQPVITQDKKDVIVELLERYREFRCLWDTTSELYPNSESCNEAFMSRLEIYKKLQPNTVLEGVKKKLENMRGAYRREMTKEEFAASQNVNPTAEPQFSMELPPLSRTVAQTKRRCTNGVEKKKEKLIDMAQSLISMKEEEWEIIGRSLGVQLKQLSENQQTIAQKLISDVLFYGKKERLMDFSSILLHPAPYSGYVNSSSTYIPPNHSGTYSGYINSSSTYIPPNRSGTHFTTPYTSPSPQYSSTSTTSSQALSLCLPSSGQSPLIPSTTAFTSAQQAGIPNELLFVPHERSQQLFQM